jgi:hypothetical protein
MNPLSRVRQLVYVLNALCDVERLLVELQLKAKDELAESKLAELALLNLRLAIRKGIAEGFGVFGDEGETDER